MGCNCGKKSKDFAKLVKAAQQNQTTERVEKNPPMSRWQAKQARIAARAARATARRARIDARVARAEAKRRAIENASNASANTTGGNNASGM